MKKILSIILILVPVLLSSCANDEYDVNSTIYGIVSDTATGEPIAGATVQLSPGGDTKLTGEDGYFEFDNLTSHQYTITVQKTGYTTNRKSITAVFGEKNQANITLTKGN